jgi:predicted XRE-type DNA-binding protein
MGSIMNTQKLENRTLADLKKSGSGHVKQAVIAMEMSVQEPAISKMEKKIAVDASIRKLKRYIEAIGGSMEVVISLPDGTRMSL